MSSFTKAIAFIAIGVAAVLAPYVIPFVAGAIFAVGGAALGSAIAAAGVGLVLSGVGSLISGGASGNHQAGVAAATTNPVAPWSPLYGERKVGGTVLHIHEFGDNDKYLDMVIVLAPHACAGVDRLYFDDHLIQIDPTDNTSFTPVQQTVNIVNISRTNNVITVVLGSDIPYLEQGSDFYVQNVTGDHTMNGRFSVESIINRTGGITFTYILGGTTDTFSAQGQVKTAWVDFGRKVYFEALLGNHTSTFTGMLSGTPNDGDTGDLIQDGSNPWGASDKLLGRTSFFIRLHFNDQLFSGGIPKISVRMRGKNDIYDHRTGTNGYTRNAALCIADFLAHPVWGFKAAYGTEIPYTQLDAAANISDEAVTLANGSTEPRYCCDVAFPLTMRRGEILQNLLTSCAGDITYQGGQFIIWPAAWRGSTPFVLNDMGNMNGELVWHPTPTMRDLYNGVKGTFVSPSNRWQASDFPPYAQDSTHGYSASPAIVGYYDVNLTADGGERRWFDIQLPCTTSVAAAQRIAKIYLLRNRALGSGKLQYNMFGYAVQCMDVLSTTVPFLGWTNKLLEVRSHRFIPQKVASGGAEGIILGTEFDVVETSPGIYDWSVTEENTPQGYRQTTLPTNTFPVTTEPPSQIRNFLITGGFPTYTSSTFTLQGTGDFPVALNNFAGCELFNVLAGDFDHPSSLGRYPIQDGATNWKWAFTLPIPDADQTWQVYAVTYGIDPITGLVVSGPWLPVTSPTINETPHVTAAISANVPGNITSITDSVDNTDAQISLVTFSATAPSPLHGFDHVDVYLRNITGGVTDVAHYDDTQQYSGSGAVGGIIQIPKLAYAATYQIWFVSGNAAFSETLVQGGGGASATIASVAIPARATTVAPPAPTVGTVTAPTVFFSDLIADNQQHWGVKNCAVAAPSLGWVTGQTLLVQLVRISPLGTNGEQFISELWEKSTTPSTDNLFPTGTNPYLFEHVADFPRPTFSNNETWLCRITPKNAGSDASLFTESATFPVIGGGGGTLAPNVTALVVTAVMDGPKFWVDTVTTLDVNYVYDNFIEHRIVSDVGTSAEVDNQATHFDNGDFASSNPKFNVSTRQLTWRIGPYDRPDTGTQVWAVRARCYNGKGNQTPSPFESAHLTIAAVSTSPGTTGILVTGFNFVRNPTNTTIDGMELASFKLTWTNPISTDAASIQIEIRDLTTPSFPSSQVLNEQISQYGPGASRSLDWSYPTVNVTLQAIWFTVNADGVQIGSAPPNIFLTVTAGSGSVDLTRADPSKLSAEFTRNSGGQFSMVSLSVGKLAAGSVFVAMNLGVGGSITVNGTNYNLLMNTTVGLQITSAVNQSIAKFSSAFVQIQGTGSISNQSSLFNAVGFTLAHSFGSSVVGASDPFTTKLNLTPPGFQTSVSTFTMTASASGHLLRVTQPGSKIQLDGIFQMTVGGALNTIVDASGAFWHNTYLPGGGSMPGTTLGKIPVLNGSGALVGYVQVTS